MSDNTDYIPYSDEWKKEMMKWSKSDLIDFLRKQLRKINELEAMQESNEQAVRVALEMAAEKAILDRIAFVTDKKVKGYDYVIDKHSITSIHSQVMDKLKIPTK